MTIIFKKAFSLKPLGQSKLNFMWSLLGKREHEFCKKNHFRHITKIAAMAIYGKILKHILLQNLKFYDLETWHAALRTRALQNIYKW